MHMIESASPRMSSWFGLTTAHALFRSVYASSSHPIPAFRHASHPTLICLQVINNHMRMEWGAPADLTIPTAADVFLRIGILPHFDVRVRADTPAGRAIAADFGVEHLTGDEGEKKVLEDLQLDLSSRASMTTEQVLECIRRCEREEQE